eukprot:Skav208176  [mRNA]  locus=scaffold2530:40584:49536:- [translate_table: standard]
MDFCCGMGGFSLGSQRLGIQTAVFVDPSSLACQAVRANFPGHVIQGDLGDMNTVKQAHAHRKPGHLQVTGGFACQGFSTQGDQNGMADRRSHSLLHILRGAWLLQADDILLECVANVVNFPAAQQVIDDFAEATAMKTSRLVFDLKDQWPARRNRFWCYLTGASLPRVDLKPWTVTSDFVSLGSIMPMDALWPPHEEEQYRPSLLGTYYKGLCLWMQTGFRNTSTTAELTAMISALEWASPTEMDLALWSDSHSTVLVADYIQATGTLPPGVSCIDLWSQFQQLMEDRTHLTTWIRWVPGHLDPSLAEDGFEEWLIKWNDLADQTAKQANLQRPAELWSLRERAARRLADWSSRLRQVRQFYFSVANQAMASSGPDNVEVVTDDHSDDEWMWLPWEDHLPIDWHTRCPDDRSIPSDFLRALIVWVLAAERLGGTVRHMTDLELVFALVQDPSFCFPFQVSGSKTFQMRRPDSLFQKPTLAMFLRPVQSAMTILGEIFSHVIRVPPGSCPDLGVHMKFSGTSLLIPDELWGQTRSQMQAFTATRPVRRSADLARPLA